MFQSRNRETFDFNWTMEIRPQPLITRFNLVIEKLLISTEQNETWMRNGIDEWFQSRNRETFDFNRSQHRHRDNEISVSIS